MDTIVDFTDWVEAPFPGSLPGSLALPPAAKLPGAHPQTRVPPIPDVEKPRAAPARSRRPLLAWAAAGALVLPAALLGSLCWLAGQPTQPSMHVGSVAFIEARPVALHDPLEDFLLMAAHAGVEPAGQECPPCCMRDAGRIRRGGAEGEAFIMYHVLQPLRTFEVTTHTLIAADGELVPAQILSFWTSADEDKDGQPDGWLPAPATYHPEETAEGWEHGTFRGALPAQPFVKITFEGAGWAGRHAPEVGSVRLGEGPEAEDALPSDEEVAFMPDTAELDDMMLSTLLDVLGVDVVDTPQTDAVPQPPLYEEDLVEEEDPPLLGQGPEAEDALPSDEEVAFAPEAATLDEMMLSTLLDGPPADDTDTPQADAVPQPPPLEEDPVEEGRSTMDPPLPMLATQAEQ